MFALGALRDCDGAARSCMFRGLRPSFVSVFGDRQAIAGVRLLAECSPSRASLSGVFVEAMVHLFGFLSFFGTRGNGEG